MVVSTICRGGFGTDPVVGGGVHPILPKHYSPIYYDSSYIGAVSGGRVESGWPIDGGSS